MRTRPTFDSIQTVGGLLPSALLERVGAQDSQLEAVAATDYYLAPGERLGEAITRSWNRLLGLWEHFSPRLDRHEAQTGPTRQEFLLPLLQELGYGHLTPSPGFEIADKPYPISHVWESAPIHLLGVGVDLDTRTPGVAGAASTSPHGLVQEFLNRTDDYLWAVVSNGAQLRLLRDNASLTRSAYVEFDLREMFTGEIYSDFAVLWLTCHASRLEGPAGKQVLENWRQDAARRGTRALAALRDGVEAAIEELGSAAIGHPSNVELRQRLDSGSLEKQEFYRQLLRIVYRFLFLLVAESRGLLHDPEAETSMRRRYERAYSVSRLREVSITFRGGDQTDLWRQHLAVARALELEGEIGLGLPALGGFLWSADSTGALNACSIPNHAVLSAVRSLTTVAPSGEFPQRVDYANLGSEELGSIYESLLEYIPDVDIARGFFELIPTAGNERKTSGSYYTQTPLISALLDQSLDLLINEAAQSEDPETRLLDLKVVDPAAGSGHFLIAAAHRIADRLARVRTSEDEPSPAQLRAALRDVISRCIFAVDINPMAVELAKVSLWIEAIQPGKPLTFLDHHVRVGNGIMGATPAMLSEGIPDDVFKAKKNEGDDPSTCTTHRKRNKAAREGQASLLAAAASWSPTIPTSEASQISRLPEDTIEQVQHKAEAWEAFIQSEERSYEWSMGDAYCAAVTFARSPDTREWAVTPYDVFYELRDNADAAIQEEAWSRVSTEAKDYQFFHWHLAFPEVFANPGSGSATDRCGWAGGFDVVLGNPPWDTLSPDRKEFFKTWLPGIAGKSSQDQETEIETAIAEDQRLANRWEEHKRFLYSTARFFRRSGRYRMFAAGNLGKGDLNIYRAFVELALTSSRQGGMAAQVAPSGIYGGANNAAIRAEMFDRLNLLSMFGYDNSHGYWFPGVGLKAFATYVVRREPPATHFKAAFGISSAEEQAEAMESPFDYPLEVVRSIDEEALIIPEVRPGVDAQVMRKLVGDHETFGESNHKRGWHPYRAEIHMGNDAHLFTKDDTGLPVYEGRMVDSYDHRAKVYLSGAGRSSKWSSPLPFDSSEKRIRPQWYILEEDLPTKLKDSWRRYRIGFLDVANPKSDLRCLTACIVPKDVVCGDKVPTISFEEGAEWRYAIWLACANSVVMDFIARRRIALKVSFTVMDTLPFPVVDQKSQVGERLIDRALRLTCVSSDMEDFRSQVISSVDLSESIGQPAALDPDERAQIRAEIDAVVARELFGLARDEFEHVLDDFTILREREERSPTDKRPGFGEFRTKRLALEAYDALRPTVQET